MISLRFTEEARVSDNTDIRDLLYYFVPLNMVGLIYLYLYGIIHIKLQLHFCHENLVFIDMHKNNY
jgi:hypothetical protein